MAHTTGSGHLDAFGTVKQAVETGDLAGSVVEYEIAVHLRYVETLDDVVASTARTSEIGRSPPAAFGLTPEELAERLPSGLAKTFDNRVGWAATYLYRCCGVKAAASDATPDRPARSAGSRIQCAQVAARVVVAE